MIEPRQPLTICDLTQSYSATGAGGVTTYLRRKKRYVLDNTPHTLLQIVPGPRDAVFEEADGRYRRIEIGSDLVHGSPNYRFILRTGAVRQVLEEYHPCIIESLCPWLLPWTAIRFRRTFPGTTLVAGYHTDFPNAQVNRVALDRWGPRRAWFFKMLALGYAEITYREFDKVYALGQNGKALLERRKIKDVALLDLGVDGDQFHPAKADRAVRAQLGHDGDGPLLVYAGRLDAERRPETLLRMMHHLPRELGARLVFMGEGRGNDRMRALAAEQNVHFTGFVEDREQLAGILAAADIYVSAMADETFGMSVLEAQASGLPVVGVAAGAMTERVEPGTGLLGPVDDAEAMARNVLAIWHGDPTAMGARARALVEQRYSWDRTFDRLFGDVYPAAQTQMRLRTARRWRNPLPRLVPRIGDRWGNGNFGLR